MLDFSASALTFSTLLYAGFPFCRKRGGGRSGGKSEGQLVRGAAKKGRKATYATDIEEEHSDDEEERSGDEEERSDDSQ